MGPVNATGSLLDREEDRRAIVEAVVRARLRRQGAERELAELPLVFDSVYRAAERRLDGAVAAREPTDALPFDPSFVAGTLLATTVWIACSLLRARRLRSGEEQVGELVRRLAAHEGSVARIQELDRQVDELIAAIASLSMELTSRAATPVGAEIESAEPTRVEGSAPADLVLLVARKGPLADGSYLLAYLLLGRNAGGGRVHERFPPRFLHRDPGPYLTRLLETAGRPPDARRAADLGGYLGQRLLPDALAARLRGFAAAGAVLEVVCDDPAIPWELLQLGHSGEAGRDGAVLGESFALAQWPLDRQAARALTARRIAVVAPQEREPIEQPHEFARLAALAGSTREVVRLPATRRAVVNGLAGGDFDVVHFCGHSVADAELPERSSLLLEGHERLTPVELAALGEALGPRSPLVVLNSCQSAGTGLSLAGIGGLAIAFLEAGAGAVVATRWSVRNAEALAFVEAFYPEFLAGTPVAEAVRRARCALRDPSGAAAAGLAYTYFGHPAALLRGTGDHS